MIDDMYVACLAEGNTLAKQLDKYLVLLESELCHEMLPKQLQSVALSGLATITGLDILGWRKMQKNILAVTECGNCKNINAVTDMIAEWKEYFIKMLKFIEIIPDESLRFYDDEVKEDVRPLCEWGTCLVNKLIQWALCIQEVENAVSIIQESTNGAAM